VTIVLSAMGAEENGVGNPLHTVFTTMCEYEWLSHICFEVTRCWRDFEITDLKKFLVPWVISEFF